jgi:hypothetical protein
MRTTFWTPPDYNLKGEALLLRHKPTVEEFLGVAVKSWCIYPTSACMSAFVHVHLFIRRPSLGSHVPVLGHVSTSGGLIFLPTTSSPLPSSFSPRGSPPPERAYQLNTLPCTHPSESPMPHGDVLRGSPPSLLHSLGPLCGGSDRWCRGSRLVRGLRALGG